MEIKKSEKASLENKRLLFTEVGLVAALLVVLAGFESSTRAREVAVLQGNTRIDDDDDVFAVTIETPPPAPEVPALPQLSDELEIVDDNVLVDMEFQSLDDTDVPVDIQEYIHQEVIEEEVEEEVIFVGSVEQTPTFNGGDANDFSKWVNSRLVCQGKRGRGACHPPVHHRQRGPAGGCEGPQRAGQDPRGRSGPCRFLLPEVDAGQAARPHRQGLLHLPRHLQTAVANDRFSVVNGMLEGSCEKSRKRNSRNCLIFNIY